MWRVTLANERALPEYEAHGEYVNIMVQVRSGLAVTIYMYP